MVGVGRPVDFAQIIGRELSTVEGTGALAVLG